MVVFDRCLIASGASAAIPLIPGLTSYHHAHLTDF